MLNRKVIYSEEQTTFFKDALRNQVVDKMLENANSLNIHPGKAEIAAFNNNVPRIKNLIELSGVQNTYITFEYLVPYTMKRIDCMIYGKDKNNKGNVVHIELKQWDNTGVKPDSSEGNFFTVNAFTGGKERTVPHPSQQVQGYNDYLINFVEVLNEDELSLTGAAYCYNYKRWGASNTALYDPQYDELLTKFRTYSGDEVSDLANLLSKTVGNGDGISIFNKMMNSSIRPSKKLLDSAANLIHEGNANAFSLIEDQIVARNIILDKIKKLQKIKRKSVILVKGGPGTGKTVIALHLLALIAGMKDNSLEVHYATKSKSLLEGVKFQLPRGSSAKLLFHNVTEYIPANHEEDSIDVLMVDEAHRMNKSANSQFTKAEKRTNLPQIETLIRAAKISVFFIDDKQVIRGRDIGSTDLIKHFAKKQNAIIDEVQLVSQFRCNGSDNYLDWLEQILYNKKTAISFSEDEFDFRIFNSPCELYEAIKEKNSIEDKTTARLCAGFCWPWSKTLDADGNLPKDVQIGDFAMPWETHGDITKRPRGYVRWYEWAYKPEGIKQVGCIYTAQGFEFDYIGVIIGPDLFYNKTTNTVETDISASKDNALKNGGGDKDSYIRNIYRVLMSRGMKGCYVYICDKALKEYIQQSIDNMKPFEYPETTATYATAADKEIKYLQ